MSNRSNDLGRAYEFACLNKLECEINKIRPAQIDKNSSYYAAERAWNTLSDDEKQNMELSAAAAASTIFALEPLIMEDDGDMLTLLIQPDEAGENGDVRDILVIRCDIRWEIGLSLKHNHFAVKHSRLGKSLDFGQKWFNIPCSNEYWSDVRPIFYMLEMKKGAGANWSDLEDKEGDVYVPLLAAFMNEIRRSYALDPTMPQRMVEYLLGEYDFYKVVSVDNAKKTVVMSFNLHGSLNQDGRRTKAAISVPVAALPTRIVSMGFVPGRNNTIEIYLDGGWQFTFRIHNAATKVETSLKFDIQIVGMPATIISINAPW